MPSRALSPPSPSALTTYITSNLTSSSSASGTTTSSDRTSLPDTNAPHLQTLAAIVLHNLRHEHAWTSIELHTHSPLSSSVKPETTHPIPRPLISGIPPRRIYTHPDLQAELIRRGIREEELRPERVWVVPSQLRERWSLRMLAEVFDMLPVRELVDLDEVVSRKQHIISHERERVDERKVGRLSKDEEARGGEDSKQSRESRKSTKWNGEEVKRALLATVDNDSTVVYYIVHDGIVKPRQN